jgi:putative ABC transport system ATP-binding protein
VSFFLKKKRQKDFYPLGLIGCKIPRPIDKSSLVISFKKEHYFFLRKARAADAAHRECREDLSPGHAVVIGSNGAGKSTLLGAVAGAVTLDRGTIRIGEADVTSLPVHRRARYVARVFQDPSVGTMPTLTVEENLRLAARRGLRRSFAPALSRAAREAGRAQLAGFGLGLEMRMDTPARLLSGGQRQCLALAMAIVPRPEVLLLDEHTAALDPRTAQTVMAATLAVVADAGLTTLMVTHNMQHALDTGSRLLMMNAGRIVLDLDQSGRQGMSVGDLVERFHLTSDRMLLGA